MPTRRRVRGRVPAAESSRAGGVEGGITTGSLVVVRATMKPLSTLNATRARDGRPRDRGVGDLVQGAHRRDRGPRDGRRRRGDGRARARVRGAAQVRRRLGAQRCAATWTAFLEDAANVASGHARASDASAWSSSACPASARPPWAPALAARARACASSTSTRSSRRERRVPAARCSAPRASRRSGSSRPAALAAVLESDRRRRSSRPAAATVESASSRALLAARASSWCCSPRRPTSSPTRLDGGDRPLLEDPSRERARRARGAPRPVVLGGRHRDRRRVGPVDEVVDAVRRLGGARVRHVPVDAAVGALRGRRRGRRTPRPRGAHRGEGARGVAPRRS